MSFVNIVVQTGKEELVFEGMSHVEVDDAGVLKIFDGSMPIAMFQVWDSWIQQVPEPKIEEWTEEADPI